MRNRPWIARAVILALVATDLALHLRYSARMPARIATNFGRGGLAQGWMSRSEGAVLHGSLLALAVLLGLALPVLVRRLPRAQRLAPEPQREALDAIDRGLPWFGAALLAVLVTVQREVFRANLRVPPRLDEGVFAAALVAFGVFTAAWLGWLFWRLRRTR